MKDRKKIKIIIYAVISIAVILFLIFNANGVLKYMQLGSQIARIDLEIEHVQQKIDSLNAEIQLLQESDSKLEEVAREKYLMKKINEHALKIESLQMAKDSLVKN